MIPRLSIEQLKRLHDIMQTMLAEANDANWQELSRLDSERRVLIEYRERLNGPRTTVHDKASDGVQASPDLQTESGENTSGDLRSVQLSGSPAAAETHSSRQAANPEYLALSAELKALDEAITTTVLNARQALLEQTRGLRAQVSAKKGYEQASTMKVSSYS